MKNCSKCGTAKPLEDFKRDRRAKSGYTGVCKDCWNADHREWRLRQTREKQRERHRRQTLGTHGITLERFAAMLKAQEGRCAICQTKRPLKGQFDVDHDHSCCPGVRACGKCIRGLLCRKCNMILGLAKDNPLLLRRAAAYLEGRGEVML